MANEELTARLKTFALILKFGHDLFDMPDLNTAAAKAVSDSRSLLEFTNAVLFKQLENGTLELLAQFAQPVVNPHAAAVLYQKQIVSKAVFEKDRSCAVVEDDSGSDRRIFLCCKLESPPVAGEKSTYIWLLEYAGNIPAHVENTAKLLGRSIAEALSLAESSRSGSKKVYRKIKRRWKIIAAVIPLLLVIFLPVREHVTADFMLKAPHITAAYAWFDGPIAQCLKQDGSVVRKGELIARYDVAQLKYRLANARSALREAEADLELEQQRAFTEEERLGKVKLLQAKCNTMKIAVNEALWYLQHAEILSPADGILALADGRAELLSGKAVRTGDKLFEVFDRNGLVAKIMVNERDASILQQDFSATLFLHTMPEKGIRAKVTEVARYPELTEQKSYCYPVTAQFTAKEQWALRFGMRGVAKLAGGKVPCGYLLFKNLILYFRKW